MKKISNKVNIKVNKNMSEEKGTKERVKDSLGQIDKLSQEIDQRIANNKYSKGSKGLIQPMNKGITNNKVSEEYEEQDSRYWFDQKQPLDKKSQNTTSKTLNQSIHQYLFPSLCQVKHYHIQSQQENRLSGCVDIQSYEEYKKIKSSNNHFKLLISKLQALRRQALKFNESQLMLKNESDILQVIERVIKAKVHQSDMFSQQNGLLAIDKLEEIEQSLQIRVQNEKDSIKHQQRIIEQLKNNEKSIKEDTELLQSRNIKFQRQVNSLNLENNPHNSSSQQQPEQQQQAPMPIQSRDRDMSEQMVGLRNEKEVDFEGDYVQLMKFYQLYNLESGQVEQSFPKNKTEAMMLLNKLQTKIQQLQMLKLISLQK